MKHALVLALALHGAPEPSEATNEIDTGALGLGLAAAGAVLATGTATTVALVEALSRPDDPDDDIANPELVQYAGFATIAIGSLSAVLVLAGGAMIIEDALTDSGAGTE